VLNKLMGERRVIIEAAVREYVGVIFARLAVRGRPPGGLAVVVYLWRCRGGERIGM